MVEKSFCPSLISSRQEKKSDCYVLGKWVLDVEEEEDERERGVGREGIKLNFLKTIKNFGQ